MELQVPVESVVSLIVQSKQRQTDIVIRLFDSLTSDVAHEPLLHREVEAANMIREQQTAFLLTPNKDYYLVIFYQGERQFNSGEELCEYYNLFLAVNTVSRLQQELQCLSTETKKSSAERILDFQSDVPALIKDKDFRNDVFELSGFVETRFPKHYEGQDNRKYLMKTIEIVTTSLIDVEASIKFDQPFTMMELGLFDNIKFDDRIQGSPDPEDFEPVTSQLPLSSVQTH